MSPSISIVIRTLNEASHIGRLLAALDDQTVVADEVIVVDSGSSDGTVEIAERFGCKLEHIPPSDFTFGRSLNWGCEAAKGDILVLASAHVYPVDKTWLEELVRPFASDSQIGLVYGGQTGDDRSNFAELQLFAKWFPDESNVSGTDPFCNNANAAVRRDLWERWRYDETLPGLEDIAFGQILQENGFLIAYAHSAKIVHLHEEGFKQTLNRYRREAMAYSSIAGKHHMTLVKAYRLTWGNVVADVRAAIRQRRVTAIPTVLMFRVAQFSGAYLGHRTKRSESSDVVKRMYYPR